MTPATYKMYYYLYREVIGIADIVISYILHHHISLWELHKTVFLNFFTGQYSFKTYHQIKDYHGFKIFSIFRCKISAIS